MAKLPCASCHHRDKAKGLTRCIECWLRAQPIQVRQRRAEARALALPEALRLSRVSKDDWPPGRRWCSGCQSFALLADVAKGGSRCKTCSSVVAHGSRVEKTYGITADDYKALFRAQHGRCYICQEIPRTKRLAVDHDHLTGEVRGLLCADSEWGCNYALLGKIKDLAMAQRIVDYLKHPPARKVLH